MDGKTVQKNISGLSSAHDFTFLPGKIAALVWVSSGTDPESNLVEMASDGTGSSTIVFKIGSNLYAGGQSATGGSSNSYHVNSVAYLATDDSFTMGDRNPNFYIKVTHAGTPPAEALAKEATTGEAAATTDASPNADPKTL